MTERIVVDPITRIEGHLRIEARDGGREHRPGLLLRHHGARHRDHPARARSRATPGPSPSASAASAPWCTASPRCASVEDALNYEIPHNAQLIRNLMIGAQYVHDHVMHFYHLHALDWVDVVCALSADPKATSELAQSLGSWPKSSPGYFADVAKRLKGFVESGQLGIFANGYWGHPAYKLPPEANLMAVAHYLEALAWQRDVVKLHAIFGGKNPHPNFVVGGVASPIDLNSDSAINAKKLAQVQTVIDQACATSWTRSMCPTPWPSPASTRTGASAARAWATSCATAICPPAACWTRTPDSCSPAEPSSTGTCPPSTRWTCMTTPRSRSSSPTPGTSTRKATTRACTPTTARPNSITTDAADPQPPFKHVDVEDGYSWLKSPRWKDQSVEVGPLARVLLLYATGHAQTKELVDMTLSKLELPVDALFSTLGRTAARTLETKIDRRRHAGLVRRPDRQHQGRRHHEPSTRPCGSPPPGPSEARGVGYMEAPRGALGHWIVIEDGKIDNYQAVVPSTWNAGPRDPQGTARCLRGRPAGQPPAGRPQAAGRDPAHHPLLRSLHRLRRASERSGIRRANQREGDLMRRTTLPRTCAYLH